MAFTHLFLVVCLAAAFVNGAPSSDDLDTKVINGRLAKTAEFPFIVSLQWKEKNGGLGRWCGGSIIAAKWILTAAHCVDSSVDHDTFFVRAGVTNSWDTGNPNGQLVAVARAIYHQGYKNINNVNAHDIALLELAAPLKFNQYVQPIALPKDSKLVPTGSSTLIGWGEAGNITHHYSPDDLLAVTTPIYPINDCKKIFGSPVSDHHVCPGLRGEGSCQGDSGGPLFQDIAGQRTLIGVCSFTSSPCALAPGVYMNVASYLDDFIRPYLSGKKA